MTDAPIDAGAWLDLVLEVAPTLVLAVSTLIVGYILAYVAGEIVRGTFSRIGKDEVAGTSGLRTSVVAGKITKALVFAIGAVLAFDTLSDLDVFSGEGDRFLDYGARLVVGLLIMFVGGFLADLASAAVARWLHGGSCVTEETDPTRDLVFLGLITSVVLMGLGVMLLDSPAVMLMFLAFLAIGVVLISFEARRKICRRG